MNDDYHFHRDPAELVQANLTKDEAHAVGAYRRAKESLGTIGSTTEALVIALPISKEFLSDRGVTIETLQDAALNAVIEVVTNVT